MGKPEKQSQVSKKVTEGKTFSVPFALENKKNITVHTITTSTPSKEELINQALKIHSQGKVLEAEKYYQNFINQGFEDNRVFINYAKILKSDGKLKEAELCYQKSIKLNPNLFNTHFFLANILIAQNRLEEAEEPLRKTIKIKPDFADAHLNLGCLLKDLGKLEEAEIYTRKAIKIKPDFAHAYLNLGNIFTDLGKREEAEIFTRKAIKLNYNFAAAHNNLGCLLKDLGKSQEAEISIRKAIELNPDFASAYSNLGGILNDLRKSKEAEISIRKAIKLNPDFANAYYNLGLVLKDLGKMEEAFYSYKIALKKEPKNPTILAELIQTSSYLSLWSDTDKYSDLLSNININLQCFNPFDICHVKDEPLLYLQRAINYYNKNFKSDYSKISYIKKDKIHIGYFSADFREHPVMYLISRILELHDHSKYKIFIYSLSIKEDKNTKKLKKYPFNFRSIHGKSIMDSEKIAKNDQLDIAVDLMNYTKNHKMNIFSKRIAPIQINYLGLPASTGSSEMDYLIADKITIPKEYADYYSEKILYMPNCYMPFNNQSRISKKEFYRSNFYLPEDAFVLASFHGIHKITPREISCWSRILKEVPNAILWISDGIEISKNNLLKHFNNKGIDSSRIYFAQRMESREEHLSRHSCADLFIDTFTYNAHSTAIDSLYCGLPVITLMGKSFISRVAGSLLTTLELTELIAHTTYEYEEIIIKLAKKPDLLMKIKLKLKDAKQNNILFNSEKYTQDLENLYKFLIINLCN